MFKPIRQPVKYICQASQVLPEGSGSVAPLCMNNLAVGGGAIVGQVGITGASGLNNIGLLVRTTGMASANNATTFSISDGSGVALTVSGAGDGSAYVGQYVAITGIGQH